MAEIVQMEPHGTVMVHLVPFVHSELQTHLVPIHHLAGDPLEPPQVSLGVPGPHFENQRGK